MLTVFKTCGVDAWANELKEKIYTGRLSAPRRYSGTFCPQRTAERAGCFPDAAGLLAIIFLCSNFLFPADFADERRYTFTNIIATKTQKHRIFLCFCVLVAI